MEDYVRALLQTALAQSPKPRGIARYGLALLAALAATGVRFLLEGTVLRNAPYLPFILAIICISFLSGIGPSIFTTLISALANAYFFLDPPFAFRISKAADIGGLLSFVLVATIINVLIAQLRRSMAAEIKRRLSEQTLRRSLDDQVTLLREIHHRVKNNLQIVCSLLSIQAGSVDNPEAAAKLDECNRRVRCMSMIHEQLYCRDGHRDFGVVHLDTYGRDLTALLFDSYAQSKSITYRLEVTPTRVVIEQAVPCGLILNELITNALKYAYPERKGEILIHISSEGDRVTLKVADQGVGIPADFAGKSSNSLGMSLVEALTAQLKGQLEIGPPPGASFTVRFLKRAETSSATVAAAAAAGA